MAKSKQKYYVVWKGVEPGIYSSWAECQAQIKGYPNAEYKSFKTKEQAMAAYHDDYLEHVTKSHSSKPNVAYQDIPDVILDSFAVDAACSGNPGDMEYRGVDLKSGVEIFRQGPFKLGTNNVGEFLALVHVLALCKKENKTDKVIYTDSRIAMGWVQKGQARTKLKRSAQNEVLFRLITRAESWLKSNKVDQKVIKWKTKEWGEIPADFGRK